MIDRINIGPFKGPFILFVLLMLILVALDQFVYDGELKNGLERLATSVVGIVYRIGEKSDDEADDTFSDCDVCPEMVVVSAGNFTMGSPRSEEGRDDDEGPQHQVTISRSFAVGKYEVTREQFAAFVAATRYDAGDDWRDPPGSEQSGTHPVVNVSWDDARTYVEWLSRKTGHQYRLLSEAEWEYVARAGTTTRYHFGDIISPGLANYDENNGGTVEVGLYSENKFGLHDMHGNVREWVEDCWHNDYKGAPADGSAWLSDCDEDGRVLRGGSWDFLPRNLRSAVRNGDITRYRSLNSGIRVARTLEP